MARMIGWKFRLNQDRHERRELVPHLHQERHSWSETSLAARLAGAFLLALFALPAFAPDAAAQNPTNLKAVWSGPNDITVSWTRPSNGLAPDFIYEYAFVRPGGGTVASGGIFGGRTQISFNTGVLGTTFRLLAKRRKSNFDASLPNTDGSNYVVQGDWVTLAIPGDINALERTFSVNTPATGAPTISGTARVGRTLTASAGNIADSDGLMGVSYSWQWVRVENDGTESNVSGATGQTYTPVDEDLGRTLKVRASFIDNAGNSEMRTSSATSAVASAPGGGGGGGGGLPSANSPATGEPTISGTAQVGSTLTASAGTIADADGLTGVSYSWQWIRVESGGTESDIANATNATYLITGADLGRKLKVRASFADNAGNSENLTSAATLEVASATDMTPPHPANTPATGAPAITGTAQVGTTLTADRGTIADADGLAGAGYAWQWLRIESGGAERDIPGATGVTYVITGVDLGRKLKVRASFTDDAGNAERLASAATATVVANAGTARVKSAVRTTLAAVTLRSVSSALDNIGPRFATSVPTSGDGEQTCVPDAMGNAKGRDGCDPAALSRAAEASELQDAGEFSLTLSTAEGPGMASSPLWSVWGRGDLGTFEGRPVSGMRYEGELSTGWFGVDARDGPWVAGIALSHGTGEAEYSSGDGASGSGRLETTLTALHPYGRWTTPDGLELRGVLGAGRGEALHWPEGGDRETSELSMWMGSVGVRRPLPVIAGFDLAARGDASIARMETGDGPDHVDGLTADSWRLRAGVEASQRITLGEDTALTPFVEAAVRHDGGDGLAGTGVEIAGGLRYTAPRLLIEARGRWLATHTDEGARESGVSVTARMGPGAHGRGLALALNPRWGADTGGAEALWRDELPQPAGLSTREAAAMDASVSYGVRVAPHGLLTPFAETGLAGVDGRRLAFGTRYETSRMDLDVELAGERREDGAADPENLIRLDLGLRF